MTFWYEYHVTPGKEDEFLNLVKTVGQPVRDKLMADGVVLAWGVEAPLLRVPDNATHMIWYTVADYGGVEKVDAAMSEQIAKMTDASAKASAGKKGAAGGGSPGERMREITDFAKTHDYLTRDLVSGFAPAMPPACRHLAVIGVAPSRGRVAVLAGLAGIAASRAAGEDLAER